MPGLYIQNILFEAASIDCIPNPETHFQTFSSNLKAPFYAGRRIWRRDGGGSRSGVKRGDSAHPHAAHPIIRRASQAQDPTQLQGSTRI